MSSFSPELVTQILAVIASISSALIAFIFQRRTYKETERLKQMSRKVDATKQELEEAKNKLDVASPDLQNSLILLRAEIEKELRKIGVMYKIAPRNGYRCNFRRLVEMLIEKDAISPELGPPISYVYNIGSMATHGDVVPKKEAEIARDLGLKLLIKLKMIYKSRAKS